MAQNHPICCFSLQQRDGYFDMDENNANLSDVAVVGNGEDAYKVTLTGKAVSYGSNSTILNDGTICNLTSEAYPRMTNYKDNTHIKRPSLGELHGDYNIDKNFCSNFEEIPENEKGAEAGGHTLFKLGWIQGVLIPCLLNIWGVMLFLRMPWIVAQSGIFQATVIILISTGVCGLTTLSLSALSTNGEVKGGGIYFIISRSLGPEFGASVGIVLAFANAVSASLNTIGFCESFNDLLWQSYNTKVLADETDSIRLVGIIAILVMILICAIGIEWESKAQNFLIAFITIAMVDFFVGVGMGPDSDQKKAQGFTGFSLELIKENWNPDYRVVDGTLHNFFSIFAIFFPSVTGIQAGANISGDLKDPSSAIPKGTLLSLLISMISYILVVLGAGAAAVRDSTGNATDVASGSFLDCANRTCPNGLQNDYSIMQIMSVWSILIYIGCFAATLSTALTNLLTVPRLIKALGDDHIYPGLEYFAKEYGPNREPFRGYVLTFFLSSAFVLIAKINAIAPLISNFYLASYALINFCTFHAALVEPLGWRPTFKCYNKWLSLFSSLLCVAIMFFIDWETSILTFFVFFTLYLIVVYRQPDVNWGSSTQAQLYKSTLASSYRLINVDEHVKNYQPHILLLSGPPSTRPPLLDLANLITKNSALLICANLVSEKLSYKRRRAVLQETMLYLNKRKIKAFFTIVDGMKFEDGTKAIMQCCGIGKLCPNIAMMGYKTNWMACGVEGMQTYFNVLHNAFDNRLAVAILRMPGSLETPRPPNFTNGAVNSAFVEDNANSSRGSAEFNLTEINMANSMRCGTMPKESPSPLRRSIAPEQKAAVAKLPIRKDFDENVLKKYSEFQTANEISKQMSIFSRKLKNGVIDVWWLYDDGGLTMLLPYILNTRTIWSNSSLRIFTLTNDKSQIQAEEKNMADLLGKFRINYASLQMLTDVEKPQGRETRQLFDELLKPYRQDSKSSAFVTDEELKRLEDKTNRQLRLKELLLQYSKNSDLVVMSLPMPRKGVVSAPVYLSWLEVLTCDMPPFLLVRGNQTSVLTFYS
ncbi:bumetanide-sensitive sodium-(potassium)-chloride cotransporter isoform X2 [Planococcus citri]|uniref:bumetanide-sensitive sodium-(potassium)-chloride cotransporter isoform X2 n=1 Tax=Planococcus citri TaxID=170843 RepID=UPI0031F9D6E6